MDNPGTKNFIKDYWPQLTSIIVALLFMGQIYSEFKTFKENQKIQQENYVKLWTVMNEKIDKTISILNDEDDGVRGDFEVGDKHLEEKIKDAQKYEDLRSEKDKAEMKVWFYEHMKK